MLVVVERAPPVALCFGYIVPDALSETQAGFSLDGLSQAGRRGVPEFFGINILRWHVHELRETKEVTY